MVIHRGVMAVFMASSVSFCFVLTLDFGMFTFDFMKKTSYLGLYGNIGIEKSFCNSCNTRAFVIDDILQCCGKKFEGEMDRVKRESLPTFARLRPKQGTKLRILEIQDGRCFYCESLLGEYKNRDGNPVQLKTCWDHLIPFVHSGNNYDYNFVAACHVCNGIKTDLFFRTKEEAQVFILSKRKEKGYDF